MNMLIQNHSVSVKSCGIFYAVSRSRTRQYIERQHPAEIIHQHIQWFSGNRLCDLNLNVISFNHINLRRNGLISSSLIN